MASRAAHRRSTSPTSWGPTSIELVGGDIWVTDDPNDRLQRYSGTTWTAFPKGGTLRGGDIAYESLSDTLFVANGSSIERFDVSDEAYGTAIGSSGRAPGEFVLISGLALDGVKLIASDESANQIQQRDGVGSWAHAVTRPEGQFEDPEGVAVDDDGNTWIADTGMNRVTKLSPTGDVLLTIGAAHGEAGSGNGEFRSPLQVAAYDGYVYVADSQNNRIQKFATDGTWERNIGAGTCCIANPGQLVSPNGVAVDQNGVFATDTQLNKIEWFQHDGTSVDSVDSTGAGNQIGFPRGIATHYNPVCSVSTVVVANSSHDNVLRFIASAGSFSSSTAYSGPTGNELSAPRGVAARANGFVVLDTGNDRVWDYDYGVGGAGTFFGESGSCNGQLAFPSGLALAGTDILVADTGNDRVQRFRQGAGGSAPGCPDTAATVSIVHVANDATRASGSLHFTANETVTFQCRVDSGAFADCTTPGASTGSSGTFSLVGLMDGSHTLEVQATDSAMNVSTDSYTWTVDGTPPAAPTIDSGPAEGSTTASTTATFTFTVEGGTTAYCTLDTVVAPCSSNSSHTYTGLANGSHAFAVKSFDAVGPGASTSRTWTVNASTPVTIPTNSGAPSINGAAQAGRRLTADRGSWTQSPTSYGYQWQRCTSSSAASCADAFGQDGETYEVAAFDAGVGRYLRVGVRATNAGATSSFSYSQLVGPVPPRPTPSTAPSLNGTAKVNQTLSTGGGVWTNSGGDSTNAYQWLRCFPSLGGTCTGITGATSTSYVLTKNDIGTQVQVRVIRTSSTNGISEPTTSALSAVVPPIAAPSGGTVTLGGKAFIGEDVTASATFSGDDVAVSYEWFACDANGASCSSVFTGKSVKLLDGTLGKTLKVTATGKNDAGSQSVSRTTAVIGRTPKSSCAGLDPRGDEDGDALNNFIECNIVREPNGTQYMDLPSLGADPLHRDIFIEIDSMVNHSVDPDAVLDVMRAFDQAPVPNKDGSTGIRMHIDNGPSTPITAGSSLTWGNLSRTTKTLPDNNGFTGKFVGARKDYDWTEFDQIKAANFEPVRRYAFFYMLSIHRYGEASNGSSGIARANDWTVDGLGQDFIMSLGAWGKDNAEYAGTRAQQAGTLMHELGHVLGLGHGGRPGGKVDGQNYKPNYPSIMSYNWQTTGISMVRGGSKLDYSRWGSDFLGTLDENGLDEVAGLKASGGAEQFSVMVGCVVTTKATKTTPAKTEVTTAAYPPNKPLDWDCDNNGLFAEKGKVSYDVTRRMSDGKLDPEFKSKLVPADDWSNIVYSGGAIGSAGAGASNASDGLEEIAMSAGEPEPVMPRTSPNPDVDASLDRMLPMIRTVSGDKVAPRITVKPAKQGKGQKSVRVKITVRDNKRLAYYAVTVDKANRPTTYATTKKLANRTVVLKKGRHTLVVVAQDAVGNSFKVRKVVVVR